jgi:choline-sulfatase
VLISVDSLRADRLPAYGYDGVKTPGIDRLAADGVVFERAFSHVPQTLPATAALLTGRLPSDIGVRDSVGFTVPDGERLLPEMLRDRGYSTAAVVSSFLLRKETGISQGFNLFDASLPVIDDRVAALRRDPLDAERAAEHWLQSVGGQRAFLFLHLDGPHPPYGDVRLKPNATPLAASSDQLSPYDSTIASIDEVVDRLVRYLKAHQLYDQSAVVLVGSHGEGLGDHGETEHGLLTYDEALHVPLIIKPPAGEGAGRRVKIAVQQTDLVPTILNLAKAPFPGNLRGRSLTPLLDRDGIIANQLIYSESLYGFYHFGWGELTSLTDGRYRYIRGPKEELYDLDTDPDEATNLLDARPELLATFRAALKNFTPPATLRRMAAVSAEDRERYEIFGYVGIRNEASAPPAQPVNPIDKRDVVERYRRAVNLLATGDLKGATEQFKALTTQESTMRDAWMLLATTASRADRAEIAVDAYQHAIELEPANPDAHLGAAAALLRLRKLDEAALRAQHVADDAEADATSQSDGHELLAQIALARRNFELARAEATLAEEADPDRPVRAYVDGRNAVEHRRYAEALELLEPALEQVDKTPRRPLADLRLLTAEALVHVDRLSEAEYLFLEELKRSPASDRARAGLIAVYKATGRTTEAAALAQH